MSGQFPKALDSEREHGEEEEVAGEPPGLTVAELRAALAEIPGHLKVTIRLHDGVGGITALGIELDEDGVSHLAIDASDDEEDFQ